MVEAIADVEKGMSLRKASELYNIPKTTLSDYVSGRREVGATSGRAYLTEEEEDELVTFLIEVAMIGYPRTKKDVLAIVQNVIDKKGIDAIVTTGWWQRFIQRHPEMTLKSAVPLSLPRAKAGSKEVLSRYMDILYNCLDENGILNNPAAIYNCDETGLPLNPDSGKVVDAVGSKHPSYITGEGKSQFTVLACSNATGTALPPFIVLDDKNLNFKFTHGEVPGTLYGLSSNGWMNQDLFDGWFTNHFLQYAVPQRPIVLLMDGHSSHFSPATITLAAHNQVLLFVLPPNTTHITQPLDRACFAPLKASWRETCHRFMTTNPGKRVTKYDFCRLFSESWYKSMTMSNITASFRVTGIYPFDRTAVETEARGTVEDHPGKLAERTGLAYIPLYSPARPARSPVVPQMAETLPPVPTAVVLVDDGSPVHFQKSVRSLSEGKASPLPDKGKYVPLRQKTTISDLLVKPTPPCAQVPKSKNAFGKVLTSKESLKLLREKELEKELKQQRREEKQRVKAEKARERKVKSKTINNNA